MGDRLVEIRKRCERRGIIEFSDADWLMADVERMRAHVKALQVECNGLRQTAHADQAVIQQLRRECDEWIAAGQVIAKQRDELQAKLAKIQQDADLRQQFTWYCITCMERFYFEGECPICMGKLIDDGGRMRDDLCGDDFFPHESGDQCLSCERKATEDHFPYCALCLARAQRDYAIESAKIERDELQTKLALAQQRAASRAGRMPK